MIGWYCIAIFPYYNASARKMGFKKRPICIIGKADSSDYITLPISKVSHKENIDGEFDIEIMSQDYPLMKLKVDSYIRTHKQTVTHKAEIVSYITNMKEEYSELWIEILSRVEVFQKKMIDSGID